MSIRYDFQGGSDQEIMIKISDLLRDRSGWKISERDWGKFQAAIKTRMAVLKLDKIQKYHQKLILSPMGHADEFFQLTALLINPETYFFRDNGHQTALRQNILPQLIKLRSATKQLRIWSAGCSTGEEPYSLAILLRALIPEWNEWRITIIGSDISQESIQKAQKGIFKENALREIKLSERSLYFTKVGNEWLLDSKFRTMVRFYQGNLVEDLFPSSVTEFQHMDLIVCRNVFIYFHQKAINKVVEKFTKTLDPKGILLLGHGEAQIDEATGLKSELIEGALIYRKT